jgi:hypothetical protein
MVWNIKEYAHGVGTPPILVNEGEYLTFPKRWLHKNKFHEFFLKPPKMMISNF